MVTLNLNIFGLLLQPIKSQVSAPYRGLDIHIWSLVRKNTIFCFFLSQNLDEIDETLTERLIGLTEMFPESVRNATSATASGVVSGAKWLYDKAGKTVWILSTSFVILALPVIFEVERVQTEEAQLQQQKQVS